MEREDIPDSPLEKLRKKLYSQKSVDGVLQSTPSAPGPGAPQHWEPEPVVEHVVKKRLSVATLFLIFAFGFFFIAGITTAVVLFLGGRSVSSDNLTVLVEDGPVTVPGGKATSFSLTITNKNPIPITGGTISVIFPDGTVEADDASVPLGYFTDSLGTLAPGETVRKTVRAAFFGSENQKLSLPITVEYTTENSNATFNKKINYDFTISTSPVTVAASSLSETSSGQTVSVSVQVRSNAATKLENVAVRADYPFGFSATSATPEAVAGNLFVLGTLAPGEEREIVVTGVLSGQEGDERVFRFTAGALKSPDSREFGVPYMVADTQIAIAKPFLGVDLSLNRTETPTLVVHSGESIGGLVSWVNALSVPIADAKIELSFSGTAFDPNSVEAVGGFYRSSDRTILFSGETMSGLRNLKPGDTGNGSFTFASKSGAAGAALRNPTMNITVSVSGRRTGAGQVPESVSSTLTRTVKVASDLTLSSSLVRTVGGIANTGPWPPEANTETTYTVLLKAGNSVNTVANAGVVVKLPSYVRYTGKTTGSGVSYSEATREVIWSVGDLSAGGTKEAGFQIAFLPSVTQKGTSPIVVPEQTITGFDRFVQEDITGKAPSLDIQTKNDPAYQDSFGTVLR